MLDFKKDWDFRPPVSMSVAETGEGVDEVLENILKHREFLESTGSLKQKQLERNKAEIKEIVFEHIENKIKVIIGQKSIEDMLESTLVKEVDPYTVAQEIIEKI